MNTRVRASAATNASCPRYASRNTYLPYIMHGCDRFDLSRGRLRVASRSPSATSPPNYVLRRMRCNTQSTYFKFQVNRAGRKCAEDERSESEGRREARRSRPRTNRIGRALRMPKASADHFNTLESHPFTVFVVFTVERFRHR